MAKRNPFRKIRSLSDQVLGQALSNHAGALQYVVSRIGAYDRYRWVRRAWVAVVTAAIVWLTVTR